MGIHLISSVMGDLKTLLQKRVKSNEGKEKESRQRKKNWHETVVQNLFTQRVVCNWQQ